MLSLECLYFDWVSLSLFTQLLSYTAAKVQTFPRMHMAADLSSEALIFS
jgi:hypothetical protein